MEKTPPTYSSKDSVNQEEELVKDSKQPWKFLFSFFKVIVCMDNYKQDYYPLIPSVEDLRGQKFSAVCIICLFQGVK